MLLFVISRYKAKSNQSASLIFALRVVTVLPDEDREREPPDPIPNSEVKPFIADGSVGSPHVRVGHRQASNKKSPPRKRWAFFISAPNYVLLEE